ncbi:MAG: TonB C-terminal domain-containing protein [Kofleriaceae bacterium]|jgi:hypothetical protein|nr:TonB C-terminal domain-containing protein [Kofleriaceae bacterium]MBP6838668.1 TonB C-terminal domain-containing protein [Kofleriaceae bacterium]
MHTVALIGTMFVLAALAAPPLVFANDDGGDRDAGPNLDEMEAIEATLAYKKVTPPKLPQKDKQAPTPKVEEGVSTDANKVAQVCKTDGECGAGKVCRGGTCVRDPNAKIDPASKDIDLTKFMRPGDPDSEVGTPTEPDVGQFDGSEHGFAEESKGDPYFQKLVGDLRAGWEYPEISKGEGVPVGCFHLTADGKVADTKFKEKSGNAELDDSVERAIAALAKARNQDPIPVPTHLLKTATTRWICFRFSL